MACELLCKEVVLKLVFAILLGIFCGNSEAWKINLFENKVICQGERVKLHCANASMGLTIYSALYGRTEPGHVICPYNGAENDKNYNCGEADVTDTLKTLCEKRNKCRVKVNSALFGDPCLDKHLYLNLVYSCDLLRRRPKVIHTSTSSSTVTKATITALAPTSSLVSFSSFSSTTIFPTVDVIASTSSILISQSTPRATAPPTFRTASTTESDSEVDNAIDPFQVEQAGSASKSDVGSLGIAGSLFMWLLFMQEHSSNYITVFCASAAGALALAIIVGLIILYRHHNHKQQLQVKDLEPKFNTYGSTGSKTPTEVDPFLSGPIKTPPPDYMLEGYNWQRGGTLPHKSSQNGTVVRTFSAKDVHTKELNGERQTDTPRYHRGPPQFAPVARRQENLNPDYRTNRSLRIGRGRHVNTDDRRGPNTRESGTTRTSAEALYY
ncbi:uncharacterized protein LOC144656021 isoform X1 [Oculina patagonica]